MYIDEGKTQSLKMSQNAQSDKEVDVALTQELFDQCKLVSK